ncbi:MAG: response regulator [Lachnospiraceae bacterium]|nr:response regulator [Lachnospiraceae bacterium]
MGKETDGVKKNAYSQMKERFRLVTAVSILLAVVLISTGWLFKSSQTTTEAAVYDVSELYLEELTIHKVHQLTSTLDSQIQQLFVTIHALRKSDLSDQKTMQEFIGQMQLSNGFDFFALIDEQGNVYTRNAVLYGGTQFVFGGNAFIRPRISLDQNLDQRDLVLITIPMENWWMEGRRLTAATVGIDAEEIASGLSLSGNTGRSFCNIIMPDGSYVIRTPHDHLGDNQNLFLTLENNACFEKGTSLELWQKNLREGQAGMVVYGLQDILHYTYYMPIEGTDWFITTTLHYDLISGNVDVIRTTLTRNSIFQLLLILLILLALLVVYAFMHKRNDRLWMEKMQAEESSKAKSVFLSNMSHDIRTPMNAIIGFTNLAIKNVEEPDKVRDYLAKILASGNHLLALVNDVLEMSRIESGKIQLEESACDLSEILYDLKNIIFGQIQHKQQEFLIDDTDLIQKNVYCDKLRMNQILLNLLGNAIKFTPAGGKISVRVEQQENAPRGYGAYVIRVKDNGIGMTPEFAKKVFIPFERERTSTVSGIQGTGLGMSITKNIVDRMNGTIEVVTAPGQGTEFIVKVNLRLQEKQEKPAKTDAIPAIQEEEENAFDFQGRRILLVEDNELNREIAREILTEAGFEVDEEENGLAAVERIQSLLPGYYDVVLMDIQMPVMDGYEATRTIRALENTKLAGVPIIAMTANAFEEDRQAALDTGMNGHLAKPVDAGKLFEVLAEIIETAR